jgi:hypothetical protein
MSGRGAATRGGLFLFFFDLHGFKVFGLENLAAIQALDVIHAVAPGDDLGTGMVASGLHNSA